MREINTKEVNLVSGSGLTDFMLCAASACVVARFAHDFGPRVMEFIAGYHDPYVVIGGTVVYGTLTYFAVSTIIAAFKDSSSDPKLVIDSVVSA